MNNLFPILAIETSDRLCSVAILIDDKYYSEININGKHIHSEKLIPMVNEILNSNNIDISQVNSIAISEGPGSFTGLRIGMAAAKGIAAGSGLPIIPVPTFIALANKIADYLLVGQRFAIAKKASKDEVYFVKFVKTQKGIEELISLSLLNKEKVSSYIENDDLVFSNTSNTDIKDIATPTAIDIGRWAYLFGKDLVISNYDLLEPKYFKEFKVRNI
ncbi:MAG TPA: tRNA (adenosine(37)-N6)-threonylcarbamoyltransferase complex dimerization subunit type 1 TsaB [Ignavibacteria bacterium]|nr:tRNA (adenosine(37)-N6)-threonylcarbamoyltransferase complex dimerization subunit type 1 TsaB [Ignavibacteria bacterium]